MTNKEFAFLNCINEKKANRILNWFLDNFDEKDIKKLADILADAVKKSTATINDFFDACIEIKNVFPDYSDIWILEDLRKMANQGVNAAKAGEEMAKVMKKMKEI